MERSFRIANLIVAFIKGEITSSDLAILDEWIEEAEENKTLFISFMDEAVFEKEKGQNDPVKLDIIFARIKVRKDALTRKRYLRIISMVAASVAIIFSVVFVVHHQKISQKTMAENSTITVGQQIAYLLLASGEKIILKEHQTDTIIDGKKDRQIILNNGQVKIEELGKDVPNEEEYHIMEVPRGAEYNLTLSDGTRVWLNADSKLKFPTCFSGDKRYVELSGEAYFEVTRNEIRPFIVHSGEVDIEVLGTEFSIRNYADRPTLTTLVKGQVKVTDRRGWKAILKPGQQAVTNGQTSCVREVEPLYYTAWKDGYFIFEATPLREIMEELSLWYNCEYFFENSAAADLRITARLKKYNEIDVLIGILSKTNEIQIKKKGHTIMIRRK